jgi:hypothetical protein
LGTWITHLRLAERLLDLFPSLDEASFAFGNLAPDSGVPNEDRTEFVPPKERTHFFDRHQGEEAVRDLDFRFLRDRDETLFHRVFLPAPLPDESYLPFIPLTAMRSQLLFIRNFYSSPPLRKLDRPYRYLNEANLTRYIEDTVDSLTHLDGGEQDAECRVERAGGNRDQDDVSGIRASARTMESEALVERAWPDFDVSQGRNYQMSKFGWSAPVNAQSNLRGLLHSDRGKGTLNLSGYGNPVQDDLQGARPSVGRLSRSLPCEAARLRSPGRAISPAPA